MHKGIWFFILKCLICRWEFNANWRCLQFAGFQICSKLFIVSPQCKSISNKKFQELFLGRLLWLWFNLAFRCCLVQSPPISSKGCGGELWKKLWRNWTTVQLGEELCEARLRLWKKLRTNRKGSMALSCLSLQFTKRGRHKKDTNPKQNIGQILNMPALKSFSASQRSSRIWDFFPRLVWACKALGRDNRDKKT